MRRSLFPVTNQTVTPRSFGTEEPFGTLQREMNRLFDDVWRGFGVPAANGDAGIGIGTPRVDVSEDDRNIFVTAELPGLKEDDVEVTYDDGVLRIAGEKKAEHEDRDRQVYVSERAYGRFERAIPLGRQVNEDQIDASFKDGVLNITLPKAAEQERTKKISVKRAA